MYPFENLYFILPSMVRFYLLSNYSFSCHQESSERLAMGEAFGIKAPEKKVIV